MATAPNQIIIPVATISGNNPLELVFKEASSQSFKRGEFVYLDTTGRVAEITSTTPALILGVAAQDATGTAGTDIAVWVANNDTIFEGNLCGASGADKATAQTDVGQRYGIYRDTTNNRSMVDGSVVGANSRLTIIKHSGKDTVGDTNGRLWFQVAPKFQQLGTTS